MGNLGVEMPAQVQSLDEKRRARQARAAKPRPLPKRKQERRLRSIAAPPPRLEKPSGWQLLKEAVGELTSQLNPDVVSAIDAEVAERIRYIPTRLNEFGYDPWGFNVADARRILVICTLLYRYYFRVEVHGIENLPEGRVLVIGNHAGQVAIDAAMIGTAAFWEGDPPRILRGMGEYWLPTVPFISTLMARMGSVVGTPKNCVDLLHNEEAVIAFPEGIRGMNKLFTERYRLQRFGFGFMRLALKTSTPIVPVAVVGSEEQAPAIANLTSLGRLIGAPAFPITLTWPWLGPLGLLPLPVRYRIYFGAPMRFEGDPDDEDAAIGRRVTKVKQAIQNMLDEGVRQRPSIFF
jgi:1-acyl-sn-glycerol-3-phosphate acyltransferase